MLRPLSLAACLLIPLSAVAAEGNFDSNGVSIRYVVEGQGEAVVLIHGWMGDATTWGRDRAGSPKPDAANSPGFQLIAFDCRGHGKSGKPHDVDRYGAEMAADVVRLLDHLKIEKAHLVGYSMGAFIAGKVAATHPERVRSVVYGGQAPLVAGVGPKESGPGEVEIFAKAVDEGKDLSVYLMAVMPASRPKPTEQQARIFAKIMFDGKDVKAFAAAGRSLGKLNVTAAELKRCTAPTLFIHGGNEGEHVKARVAAVREALGHGQLKIIPGADHVTTLANREFGAAIQKFLRTGKVE